MTTIADVIGWKFNHQQGMRCQDVDGVVQITEFPGGIPSQAEQDAWALEYEVAIALKTAVEQSDAQADADAKADAVTQYLVSHTPLEIYQYVRTQVNAHNATNLAELKTAVVELQNLVGKLAATVGADIRRRMR